MSCVCVLKLSEGTVRKERKWDGWGENAKESDKKKERKKKQIKKRKIYRVVFLPTTLLLIIKRSELFTELNCIT